MDIVGETPAGEIPGGSPANVALGLGRLGVPVEFITWLGDDMRGHEIAAHLRASGVAIPDFAFEAPRTSTATVTLGSDGQPSYDFDVTWDVSSGAATPERLHTGSLGAFLQPGADAVLDMLFRTNRAGGMVSLDPNIRPALLQDVSWTAERFEELAANADVVKLSDEDAAWIYPGWASHDVLGRLHELGVRLAALTAGASGSTLSTSHESVFVPAKKTTIVDTVGAGDTYMATLLWQLGERVSDLDVLGRDDLRRIGSLCGAAAAITVSRSGANLPWASELQSLS